MSGPLCALSELTAPCRISPTLCLPYNSPVSILQQPTSTPSEHPEKQKQAAPHPLIQQDPGLIKALRIHGPVQCTESSGDCQSPAGRDLGPLPPLALTQQGPNLFPRCSPPYSGVCSFSRCHTRSVFLQEQLRLHGVKSQTVSGSCL